VLVLIIISSCMHATSNWRAAASAVMFMHPTMQGPIVSGISAVLSEQQQALSGAQSPAPQPATAAAASPAEGSRRVYFDVAVDGEQRGRIVVQLYDDVPVGAARFADLAQGKQGVGFRRTKFDAINEVCNMSQLCRLCTCMQIGCRIPECIWIHDAHDACTQDFIRDGGLRRLSFGSEQETSLTGALYVLPCTCNLQQLLVGWIKFIMPNGDTIWRMVQCEAAEMVGLQAVMELSSWRLNWRAVLINTQTVAMSAWSCAPRNRCKFTFHICCVDTSSLERARSEPDRPWCDLHSAMQS
jgi:hypothetical protein